MNVFGMEMNGGVRKTILATIITLVTGFAGYLLHTISQVAPLAVKTDAISDKLDMQIDVSKDRAADQKEWNHLFLEKQNGADTKLDAVLKAVKEK